MNQRLGRIDGEDGIGRDVRLAATTGSYYASMMTIINQSVTRTPRLDRMATTIQGTGRSYTAFLPTI